MLIAALVTIAKTKKQPECPSTEEWIEKMWHIYTVEYYSAIKREHNSVICRDVDRLRVCPRVKYVRKRKTNTKY